MENIVLVALGVVVLMAPILTPASARQRSSGESRISSVAFQQTRHRPLAVLQAGSTEPLEIFAEDPTWPHKVEAFVATTGVGDTGVQSTLNEVQHSSWAEGRTFRRKSLVLLAFVDDILSERGERTSCRLARAVLAASRHTTGAHLILVADGFELDPITRETMEKILDDAEWGSFTSIEIPEFEGFSSAVNRAMKAVSDNSVVAVLSTAALLLPASVSNPSAIATSTSGSEHISSTATNTSGGGWEASDVFVGYERLKSTQSTFRASLLDPNRTCSSCGSREQAPGNLAPVNDESHIGVEGARYNEFGHTHYRRTIRRGEHLLVTAIPSRWTTNRGSRVPSVERESEHYQAQCGTPETPERARSATNPPSPSTQGQAPGKHLSNAAPLPLLVFDTETFLALGELDEQFAFQGGVAEWISRANFTSRGKDGGIKTDIDRTKCRSQSAGSYSGAAVQHVHKREWGIRFVSSCPQHCFQQNAEQGMLNARSPDVDLYMDDEQQGDIKEQVLLPQGTSENGFARWAGSQSSATSEEVFIDQWNRLPLAKLDALVQEDADLFFLRLLLLPPPSDPESHIDSRAFHSEWMERTADNEVMYALDRRKLFPVAVVVMVHDEVAILRPSLEGVALVVEHILVVVSRRTWGGDDKDVSNALELLNDMLEDTNSATHGKLQIEVGSWATESEQRNYANDIIREDPRDFFRVVVMDTSEFWHPVELARALVQATQHPEDSISRAQTDTYWASVRSLVSPEMPNDIWLVDPRRCVWTWHRRVVFGEEMALEPATVLYIDRPTGVIRHLSYHEERPELEQLQLRPVSGNLAIVDISGRKDAPMPSWVTGATGSFPHGSTAVGSDAVWSKLLEATSSRDHCTSPPCGKGKHIHSAWADLAEEMSHVQGAVVVRRPDIAKDPGMVAPANSLDFVKTLGSYFTIFQHSLFPTSTFIAGYHLATVQECIRFINAVLGGDSTAARYLSTYHAFVDVPKLAVDGHENSPTLVGMADVFVNEFGYVWNEKDYIVPKCCYAQYDGPRASMALPIGTRSYEKVFVIAQRSGDNYYHFLSEALPRITVMLDILRDDLDIKIAVHSSDSFYYATRTAYIYELLELLGVERDRVVFIPLKTQIHAGLAILPTSTNCGMPDTQLVSMLRRALLQALYPSTEGVPLPTPRPIIVLIVRESERRLRNSDEVRDALTKEFPSYDVVEFRGTGSVIPQLKLFATASLIVGPHGAGLSNIIVSPLHTPVLEIGPVNCPSCYIHLAVKLQHIYARHPGSGTWRTFCGTEYEPKIDEVLRLVRDLFEAKRLADTANPP